MTRILTLAAIAVLAVCLAAASAASARQLRCGAYAKSDGSLADSVVTSIAVVGMSCAAGQTVANGYHGLIGSFKAYGFSCVAAQGSPQARGSVRCVKRHRRTTYNTAALTDCSMTPGINTNSAFSGRARGPTTLAAQRPSRCLTPPRRRPASPQAGRARATTSATPRA